MTLQELIGSRRLQHLVESRSRDFRYVVHDRKSEIVVSNGQLEQGKSCDKFRPGKLLHLIFRISTMTLRVNEVNESSLIFPKGCQLI